MTVRSVIWYILVPLCLLTFIFPYYIGGYINPQDEGIWLGAVHALASGQHLYRDIWIPFNPIIPVLLAKVVRIHPTLAAFRETIWVFNALGLGVITWVVYRFIANNLTRAFSLVCLWMVPAAAHARCIPMAARYAAGFLPMLAWPRTFDDPMAEDQGLAVRSGLLAGFAFWISQEVGLATLLAGTLVFAWRRKRPLDVLPYLGSAALILLFGVFFISLNDGLGNYIQCAFVHQAQVTIAEKLPAPSHVQSWQSAADLLAFYFPMTCYGLVLLWSAMGVNRFRGAKLLGSGIALYGALAAASAWGRSDQWHIYFAISPALFLGGYLVDRALQQNKLQAQKGLLGFMVLGSLVTVPHFLARAHHERYLKSVEIPCRLARCGGTAMPIWQANGYESLVSWIHKNTRPGEPMVSFPANGAIFFLANRPNACRIPILADAVSLKMQDGIINDLERIRPRWVLRDADMNAFDRIPIDKFIPRLYSYIQEHYTERDRLGPFIFLERRTISLS